MRRWELDLFNLGYGQLASSCEHCKEHLGSIKCGGIF